MSSPSLYHQSDTRIQSELRIIEKSKKNPNHFAPLYKQYHENIFRYIMKRVDDVEAAYDITSNVFVKALTNIHKYEFRGVPFFFGLESLKVNFINHLEIRKQEELLVLIK